MGESAVQLGVTLATSDPVVGDANNNNQITRSRSVREVVDDFEISVNRYCIHTVYIAVACSLIMELRSSLLNHHLHERDNTPFADPAGCSS